MNRPTKYEITNHFTNGFAQSIYELKGGTTVCINYDQTELEMLQINTIEQRALEWLLGGGTGISSKTLCAYMLGMKTDWPGAPSDASDRGRCIRLLKLIPEWVQRIDELKALDTGTISLNGAAPIPRSQYEHSWTQQIPLILAEGNL